MSNWKQLERKTAKALNGKRNIDRGMNFHLSRPDVEHPLLSIECKYRKKISKLLKDGLIQAKNYYPDKISDRPGLKIYKALSIPLKRPPALDKRPNR